MTTTAADPDLSRAATSMRDALRTAQAGLVERDVVVELIALSAVAREHMLVIGPPGTAKSEAVRRTARALGGSLFEYLLGRFTEPSEIFGPVDLKRLKDGVVETATAGMLPEADVAFLDEVFLGSTAILNTLLAILNERTFRRGHTSMRCPLRVCVGASNALPDDTTLAAFADRFLLRVFVDAVPDPLLEDLLTGGRSLDMGTAQTASSLAALDVLSAAAMNADTGPVRSALADAVRALRSAGVHLSDRRIVKLQRLAAAAAVLAGRATPTTQDLWPIVYAVPTREAQDTAREALGDLLKASDSAALAHAALEASEGPRARARLLVEAGEQLLAAESDAARGGEVWRRRAEGILREIDAAFDVEQLPQDLGGMRARLIEAAKPVMKAADA